MLKINRAIFSVVFILFFGGCSHLSHKENTSNGTLQWDFDHQVQYRKTQLEESLYLLEVVPNNEVSFDRLASFIIRKSYSLCGGYTYKLEMLKGIEEYNDKFARPHYIFPSLTARVEC